jgi:peptidyl-prolyl cis-trans isomerase B (cyclophilin B)
MQLRTPLIITVGILLLTSCGGNEFSVSVPEDTTMPKATTTPETVTDVEPLSGKHTVTVKTSQGDITLELDADAAPMTVTNFVTHAKNGYYDDLIFHRVIKDFMVQGGDPKGNGTGGESIYGPTFKDEMNAESYGLHEKKLVDFSDDPLPDHAQEWSLQQYYEAQGYVYDDGLTSLPMVRGVIAMANRGPNTNGSQFFIIHAANTAWLEGKHTVFGKVTEGMDVLDAIAEVEVDGGAKPVEDVTFSVEAGN